MPQHDLPTIIEALSLSPRVKGLFTTGTTATGLTPSSDIDLFIILDKNEEGIKSVYTLIEDRFADIFFFDVEFVARCASLNTVPANGFEGMFFTWLAKGSIKKDDSGILAEVKALAESKTAPFTISLEEKQSSWFKINYNYLANKRYFNSQDALYHKALGLRLLYSVSELVTTYFAFRDIPWRGEKAAIRYFEQFDAETYASFVRYLESPSLSERFEAYTKLFYQVSIKEYDPWKTDFLVALDTKNHIDNTLKPFWRGLLHQQTVF